MFICRMPKIRGHILSTTHRERCDAVASHFFVHASDPQNRVYISSCEFHLKNVDHLVWFPISLDDYTVYHVLHS